MCRVGSGSLALEVCNRPVFSEVELTRRSRCAFGSQASGLEYTFIRVGEMVEGKEGGAITSANVTEDLPVEQVIRDDIIRLSAEAFVMQNATGKARSRPEAEWMLLNSACSEK